MIVADASAIIELLLRTPMGLRVEHRLLARGESLHAPHVLDLEVAQVFRRYVARGEITAHRAGAAVQLLGQMPLDRYAHEPLLARIWSLRDNMTAYDAAYVALAEALRAPLVTCDERLASAPAHAARVELITREVAW